MWVVSGFRTLVVCNKGLRLNTTIAYNRLIYYFVKPGQLLAVHGFVYCPKYSITPPMLRVGFEYTAIQFRYNGKAYRVSKRGKMVNLNFHYPTYKYMLWNNLILKHKKKRKKLFKLLFNTFRCLRTNLHYNLHSLRPLNTYTKRGIYLSNFSFDQRKVKAASRR